MGRTFSFRMDLIHAEAGVTPYRVRIPLESCGSRHIGVCRARNRDWSLDDTVGLGGLG